MIGQKFGRLTIELQTCSDRHGKKRFLCLCDCGERTVVAKASLLKGYTQSCGCLRRETTRQRSISHGKTGTVAHNVWMGMRQRCYYTGHKQFKDYGGRGILVEWKTFQNFYEDIGYQLSKGLSVERIDVNKNYSKANCIVIPLKEQNKNRQSTIRVTDNGSVMCLKDACKLKGVPYERIRQRITKLGWDVNRALNS